MLQRNRVLGMIEDKTQFLEWSRAYPELAILAEFDWLLQ